MIESRAHRGPGLTSDDLAKDLYWQRIHDGTNPMTTLGAIFYE
jgi:hypothetical protein